MKKSSFFLLGLVASTAVFAAKADGPKVKVFARYDVNNNGKLDPDEIAVSPRDATK